MLQGNSIEVQGWKGRRTTRLNIKVGRKWREREESKLRYDDGNEVVCLKLRRDDIIVG